MEFKGKLSLSKANISPNQHGPICCSSDRCDNHHKISSKHSCDSSDEGKQGRTFDCRHSKDLEKIKGSPVFLESEVMLYGIRRNTSSLLCDSDDDDKQVPTEENSMLRALEIFPNVDRRRIQQMLRNDSLGTIILALAEEKLENSIVYDSFKTSNLTNTTAQTQPARYEVISSNSNYGTSNCETRNPLLKEPPDSLS